jgi:hypothetical protein
LIVRDQRLPAPRPGSPGCGTDGKRIQVDVEFPPPPGRQSGRRCWPLPAIEIADAQLREITEVAFDAVLRANDPPCVFRRGGVLVRLHVEEDTGKVVLQPLVGKVLRNLLARVADWFREGEPTAPPAVVVGDIEATADHLDFPVLDAVVTCPVATDAGLIIRPGYHERARLWHQPDPGLVLPAIPAVPSPAQVREARAFIEDNLLVDFPFVEACDRAVAWAALVLPFVRPLIDGPTPTHMVTAPTRGTGKTLLLQVLMAPALGPKDLEPMTVDCEEPEMRKRLTSSLRDSPAVILMDNLGQGRRLESSSLASVLTARFWRDRILGWSVMASLPVRCVWLATGNNPQMSDELVRRTVRSRLDAQTAQPHLRQGFKHADILAWARANRAALIRAVLILVRSWLCAGQPPGKVRLGMYEAWCRVVGGVLDNSGVEGLRQAIELYQGDETDTDQALAPFLTLWWLRFRGAEVGVKDLYDVAVEAGCLEAAMDVHLTERQRQRARGCETERSRQTRLGNALRRLSGQVHAGFRIEPAGVDRCNRQMYRLAPRQ